jgi:L-asparaginase
MEPRKKILIVSYGGTIVMVVDSERKAVVPAKNVDEILKLIPSLDSIADVEMKVLSNKDSTDVGPEDWSRLAMFLYENHDRYDGFVITHGTNTMSYTASALTLALGRGFKKPVVLTGSQLPLTVYGNDARFNFENAVKTAVIASKNNVAEIMIVFSDLILRGCRAVKTSESRFRAFESPAFPEIGTITSTGVHFNYNARKMDPTIPLNLTPRFSTNIVSIDLTPGQSPSMIESLILSGKCNGVILKSHGAGSVPIEGEFSFLPFIRKTVQEYKIPVIVSTKFLGGNSFKEINDDNAVKAIEAGAIPGGDLTDVMTEVKLMWLLAQGTASTDSIKEKVLTDYVGELTQIQ